MIGFGTVGRWLATELDRWDDRLGAVEGPAPLLVGLATARDGFVHAQDGIDPGAALALAEAGRPIAELERVERHPTALEGLRATDADVLVEVSASPATDGEPGLSHMREALGRGISVATSNKWPVALHGAELADLARRHGARFRAESTVMSGTPVLGPLTEGLAGARPTSIRGVLNATANFILTRTGAGASYADALAEAQAAGLAERDPAADVEGHDSVAKLMVLAGLVLGHPLRVADVERRGIADLTAEDLDAAARAGRPIREVATLELSEGGCLAMVEPVVLEADDPLARVEGTQNAVICRAAPLGEVMIAGPGAGPELAGQGVLSDLVAIARARGS